MADNRLICLKEIPCAYGSAPGVILATPTTKQALLPHGAKMPVSGVSDLDLIKSWPHRTRPSKNGKWAIEDDIRNELMSRGYLLHTPTDKWRPAADRKASTASVK